MRRAAVIAMLLMAPLVALAQGAGTVKDGMQAITDRYGVHFVYDSSLPVGQPFAGQQFTKIRLRDALNTLFKGTGIEWQKKGKYITLLEASTVPGVEPKAILRLDTISAASISGKIDRDINYTQTGLAKIDGAAFNRAFSALSTPDVVKTLQSLPGVTMGTEMLSTLYVHGGDGSDNLFLLDGVPLYQACHFGGLFSSFNTDVIEGVDFYKSGFPARYGGRTSSVVDIVTREGDFKQYKGQASIGLLEGRFQVEGPIVKDKTSFNIALRRSWIDALMYPTCWLENIRRGEDSGERETSLKGVSFCDLNAKVTHRFSPGNKLSANLYLGRDHFFRSRNAESVTPGQQSETVQKMRLTWGNILASLNWQKDWSAHLNMNVVGYWSASHSGIRESNSYHSDYYIWSSKEKRGVTNHNYVDDFGVTANLKWTPSKQHLVRFGGSAICHSYRPDYDYYELRERGNVTINDLSQSDTVRTAGVEASVFVEDEMAINRWFKINAGFRNTVYASGCKVWNFFEPRLAIKVQFAENVNAKVSYARMSQFSHLMASTYLDLPTNCWLPSSDNLAPMSSHQVSGGVYGLITGNFHLNVEGWYKIMENLVEYYGDNSLFPRLSGWDSILYSGRGRSYGGEVDFGYETPSLMLNAFYTLSWNERFFEQIYSGWYRDRNDNRHKLTLQASWRVNKKWELYSAWNYHSGNRMTLPTQYLQGVYTDSSRFSDSFSHQWVYEMPNNVKLPDYHRLDLGANIHGRTKRGNDYVWNISIYNVYCRINPVYATVVRKVDPVYVAFKGRNVGMFPILPSFSYKVYFGR